MPGHRQPSSLESLALGRVCQLLDASCRRLQVLSQESSAAQVLAYAKQSIRPYYAHALSARLRSQVIEETSRMLYGPSADGSTLISGPAPLYLLALLLGHDIRRLRVNLCCYYGCSHQTSLLKLLAQEGAGLESLELARSALLRLDCGLLESALGSMTHLRRLTLRNIASDAVLQVVGQACPRLLVLDVACSRQVTDAGLRQLLLSVEFRDRAPGESTDRGDQRDQRDQPEPERSAWPRLRGLLAKLRAVRGPGRRKARQLQAGQPPAGLLEQRESRRPLCDALRVLNVANTGVSSAGVLLALVHLPRLESLAEYSHMGRVVEAMKRGVLEPKAPFGLRQARSCRTTPARLELLAQACPRVERLHISEPHHPPEALALFPTLTCLSVHGIPARPDWLAGLYAYLRQNGPRMRELELRLAQLEPHAELELDARELLLCCPRLASFTTDGSHVVWSKGPEPGPLRQLRRAELGRRCAANAIVRLLSLAPDLGALHVHSCFDLTNEMLVQLLEPPPAPRHQAHQHQAHHQAHHQALQDGQALVRNLECFYIYEASKVSASTVLRMLASCRKLRRIGNLANWGLDCDGVRTLRDTLAKANLDVELCPGSHWFWSDCVQ